MKKHNVTFRQSGFFSDLVCNFDEGSADLDPFCHRRPSPEALREQLFEKSKHFPHRAALHQAVMQQYAAIHPERNSQIDSLLADTTFTVTTGHQLSLFTGPLYFIYKIIHVINIANDLKKRFPNFHFVPVYWMASEDHDFEEIQSFTIGDKTFTWEREKEGAVGRMSTEGLQQVGAALKSYLGESTSANKLVALFFQAYQQTENLALATATLVDQLFGDKGLIVVDGDDAQLKALMIPTFERELREGLAYQTTAKLSAALAEKYFAQVHIRDCNLFYLTTNQRGRFVKTVKGFAVEGTALEQTAEAWIQELHQHPERFSPNVVLRPLYQETILPNLAYIGGGGEIAYWLQLKGLFQAANVPFPILWLRQSFLFIPKVIQRKIEKLELSLDALWQGRANLEQQIVGNNTHLDLQLEDQENILEQMFLQLEELAKQTDASMVGAVKAQEQKQRNGLANLRKKLLRAEKRRLSEKMRMLNEVLDYCFPKGGLQERSQNFSGLIATFGPSWWTYLWQQDPWESGVMVYTEPVQESNPSNKEHEHVENQ
ncbi:MAG: bacillithiol biosynthesis cysteine-adding enzyme BshC [Schleiferiaceae bacterium]|nr:bacillithiol biosynthesis cysteine-adding enzyme BshC [Schleiferiaceae bacterium]